MKDQHEKITGYRDLTQQEIGLMNEGKALAVKVGEHMDKLATVQGLDMRWQSIARTHLQQGFMALTRAIARPTTF